MNVHRTISSVVALLAVAPMALLCGCGVQQGPERIVVSGTVTYQGKPIPDGAIRFVPAETSHAPVAGASIVDGHYRADSLGGVPAGTQTVQIEAYRNDKSITSRFPEIGARVQYLPKKYNEDTGLEITIQPGSGAITENFELTD